MRLIVVALLSIAGAGCGPPPPPPPNPATLWLNYNGREVDLILVDHEPPPF